MVFVRSSLSSASRLSPFYYPISSYPLFFAPPLPTFIMVLSLVGARHSYRFVSFAFCVILSSLPLRPLPPVVPWYASMSSPHPSLLSTVHDLFEDELLLAYSFAHLWPPSGGQGWAFFFVIFVLTLFAKSVCMPEGDVQAMTGSKWVLQRSDTYRRGAGRWSLNDSSEGGPLASRNRHADLYCSLTCLDPINSLSRLIAAFDKLSLSFAGCYTGHVSPTSSASQGRGPRIGTSASAQLLPSSWSHVRWSLLRSSWPTICSTHYCTSSSVRHGSLSRHVARGRNLSGRCDCTERVCRTRQAVQSDSPTVLHLSASLTAIDQCFPKQADTEQDMGEEVFRGSAKDDAAVRLATGFTGNTDWDAPATRVSEGLPPDAQIAWTDGGRSEWSCPQTRGSCPCTRHRLTLPNLQLFRRLTLPHRHLVLRTRSEGAMRAVGSAVRSRDAVVWKCGSTSNVTCIIGSACIIKLIHLDVRSSNGDSSRPHEASFPSCALHTSSTALPISGAGDLLDEADSSGIHSWIAIHRSEAALFDDVYSCP